MRTAASFAIIAASAVRDYLWAELPSGQGGELYIGSFYRCSTALPLCASNVHARLATDAHPRRGRRARIGASPDPGLGMGWLRRCVGERRGGAEGGEGLGQALRSGHHQQPEARRGGG